MSFYNCFFKKPNYNNQKHLFKIEWTIDEGESEFKIDLESKIYNICVIKNESFPARVWNEHQS